MGVNGTLSNRHTYSEMSLRMSSRHHDQVEYSKSRKCPSRMNAKRVLASGAELKKVLHDCIDSDCQCHMVPVRKQGD